MATTLVYTVIVQAESNNYQCGIVSYFLSFAKLKAQLNFTVVPDIIIILFTCIYGASL